LNLTIFNRIIKIAKLNIDTTFSVDDLAIYLDLLICILQTKQINLVGTIIHSGKWEQTLGLGFFNQQTYENSI